MATIAWPRFDRELAMKIGGLKQFNQVTRGLMASVVEGTSRASDVIAETVVRLARAWRDGGPGAGMLPEHRDAVKAHWQRVPLLREHGPLL